MDSQAFRRILDVHWPTLQSDRADLVVKFREILVDENKTQNLTRLLSPEDFYFGHVLDVKKLLEFRNLDFPAVDIGSGCGVPGLLAAILSSESWVLVESEGRKAGFLKNAAEVLGVSGQVSVVNDRIEHWLRSYQGPLGTLTARAVGPVDRIYTWIRDCSTWNSLVLFKGPGWAAEWGALEEGPNKGGLIQKTALNYTAGPENKQRILVRLDRVPRGTAKNKKCAP